VRAEKRGLGWERAWGAVFEGDFSFRLADDDDGTSAGIKKLKVLTMGFPCFCASLVEVVIDTPCLDDGTEMLEVLAVVTQGKQWVASRSYWAS
jgi:hypothetical protein